MSIQKLVVLFLECTYFLRFLICTQLVIPTEHWNIVRWVDNDQALGKTTWIRLAAPKHQLMPESDLIADIIVVRDEIHLNIQGQHVHGHQNISQNE